MKPNTNLSLSELYALEKAARLARSREAARLIVAGVDALVRLFRSAMSVTDNRRKISHA